MNYKKKYEEALERAKEIHAEKRAQPFDVMTKIFPEIKESEDERIKKNIIATIHLYYGEPLEEEAKEMIAWLEKQGEQKPADKVEPKFKVGDKIRRKTPSFCDKDMQVARIDNDYYVCNHIGKFSSEVVPFLEQSSYKLIDQNPAWSEEDEYVFSKVLDWMLIVNPTSSIFEKLPKEQFIERFKSLKERYTWKPSDEQMQFLWKYAEQNNYDGAVLTSLFHDLKKLREE